MGQVFLVKHLETGRKEAVKVLRPEVATDRRFVARFRREARATNRLYHPNVVAMHDFGQLPDGRFYLAMEYVDGAPLHTLLTEGERLSLGDAVSLACQLTAAVEHAHSRGVLHRDLKPANLMLIRHKGREDQLKVLDFGVAKIISPEYQESLMVSQEGIVFGTPLYMAPEQFESRADDPRSDVYAVGCIAFEMLTGEPPFFGKISEVVSAHVEQPPPRVSDLVAGTPAEVDQVIARCLAKDTEERYQTCGDLLADLVTLHPMHSQITSSSESGLVPNLARYDIYESYAQSGKHPILGREPMPDGAGSSSADALRLRQSEAALRELSEALLDCGAADVRLTITVADARAVEHEIRQLEAERTELDERRTRAEQTWREREGMLRFAAGELRFERDRGNDDPDLEFQVDELENRLAEIMAENDAHKQRLAEDAIELAVRYAEAEAKRPEIYNRLEMLVDDVAPQFADDTVLTPYLVKYSQSRTVR